MRHVAISDVMEMNSKHLNVSFTKGFWFFTTKNLRIQNTWRMDLKESKESSSREKIKRQPSLRTVFLYFYRLWILHSEVSRTVFIYKIKFISSIQSTIVMLTSVGFIVMQKDRANLLLGVLKNGRSKTRRMFLQPTMFTSFHLKKKN